MTAQPTGGPFTTNPVIVQGNHVFAMPADGKGVYIYDAASGQLVKKIFANDIIDERVDRNPPKMLLGVTDDCVLVSSSSLMFHIPWKTFTTVKDASDLYWASAPYNSNNQDDNNALRGRPFITATAEYVPTILSLNYINHSGILIATYPETSWDKETQGPGNVVVTQDHVIIAGDRRVDVYTDLQMATRKLDQAVAAAPNDPTPRLRYAEIMFAAGQVDIAKTETD